VKANLKNKKGEYRRNMKKQLLYRDKYGNSLFAEGKVKPKLAVRNDEGLLVGRTGTKQFIRKAIREKPSIKSNPAFRATERKHKTAKTTHILRL
jgi:hypothetical protein